jgi:mannose-1-phosphate guanylyltransferase
MTSASTGASSPLAAIDAAVLAGGLGTRLRAVLDESPKALARVAEAAFIDLLIHWLGDQGLRRVVFCLGHRAERIVEHLARRSYGMMRIDWVVEPRPLGTGGAVRNARECLTSDPVLVMNGDTVVDVNLASFLEAHDASGCDASLLCLAVDDVAGFGALQLDDRDRVVSFIEKDLATTGPGMVNAGVYLFSQSALSRLGEVSGPSLERDFLQTRPAGTLQGYVAPDAHFLDIGTPETLARAADALPDAWLRALREAEG